MNNIDSLRNEVDSLTEKHIELEIKLYKLKYPNEKFPIPEIVISFDFHKDAINIYKEFNYPNWYIDQVDKRGNWDTTKALTIYSINFNLTSGIFLYINANLFSKTLVIPFEISEIASYFFKFDTI